MTDVLQRLKPALADRYTSERELGGGGMAVVYLAHDLKHHRRVARRPGRGPSQASSDYLLLRSDPEPEVLPEVMAVRGELARLAGEPE